MDDLEGQIEAFDLGQRTLADEIKELEGGEKIDEDLKALKARVGGQSHSGTTPAGGTQSN
jgi:phage shock protein A